MEEKSLEIVKGSFVRLIPVSDLAVNLFLDRLLLIDPELRHALNRMDRRTEIALTRTLALMIEALAEPDRTHRLARRVGFRFANAGVSAEHYPMIGEAFIWTIRRMLDESGADGTTLAWKEAFDTLTPHLKQGALAHQALALVESSDVRESLS